MSVFPSAKKRVRYVLKKDRDLPEDDQGVFILRPLTLELVSDEDTDLEAGVEGWENFTDEDSNVVEFDKAELKRLPFGEATELLREIQRLSGMGLETAKN